VKNVRDALKIQGGAAGFADQIPTVLVISTELCNFQSEGERYQGWIDGGLFAMSVIYALHSLGLVTCCLNWSKNEKVDLEFKARFEIPGSESIIMLLSVGHPIDRFKVAESWRRPLDEVLEFDSSPKI
jgi:nitroreductase